MMTYGGQLKAAACSGSLLPTPTAPGDLGSTVRAKGADE